MQKSLWSDPSKFERGSAKKDEEQKKAVYESFLGKIGRTLEEKRGFTFSGELYVLKRK